MSVRFTTPFLSMSAMAFRFLSPGLEPKVLAIMKMLAKLTLPSDLRSVTRALAADVQEVANS